MIFLETDLYVVVDEIPGFMHVRKSDNRLYYSTVSSNLTHVTSWETLKSIVNLSDKELTILMLKFGDISKSIVSSDHRNMHVN